MHATTLGNAISITLLALLAPGAGPRLESRQGAASAPAAIVSEAAAPVAAAPVAEAPVAPRRLTGGVADVIVRIRGGAVCSGTPITGTAIVVTAAHCVLDRDGSVGGRTVVRDGVEYRAIAVLVDVTYHATPLTALDAAVLLMDRPIPGPSATLGSGVPATGSVTLAGYQGIDSDGTLLRGTDPHNTPLPKSARDGAGGLVEIETAPAGCENDVAAVEVTVAWLRVPCGLIPGASGGGLFASTGDTPGSIELVGVLSTVSPDIRHNGVVPLSSLMELLENQADYLHVPADDSQPRATVRVARS
jgi:hypothetical protein